MSKLSKDEVKKFKDITGLDPGDTDLGGTVINDDDILDLLEAKLKNDDKTIMLNSGPHLLAGIGGGLTFLTGPIIFIGGIITSIWNIGDEGIAISTIIIAIVIWFIVWLIIYGSGMLVAGIMAAKSQAKLIRYNGIYTFSTNVVILSLKSWMYVLFDGITLS